MGHDYSIWPFWKKIELCGQFAIGAKDRQKQLIGSVGAVFEVTIFFETFNNFQASILLHSYIQRNNAKGQ